MVYLGSMPSDKFIHLSFLVNNCGLKTRERERGSLQRIKENAMSGHKRALLPTLTFWS